MLLYRALQGCRASLYVFAADKQTDLVFNNSFLQNAQGLVHYRHVSDAAKSLSYLYISETHR